MAEETPRRSRCLERVVEGPRPSRYIEHLNEQVAPASWLHFTLQRVYFLGYTVAFMSKAYANSFWYRYWGFSPVA